MDPLAGSRWSTPGTVAGFAQSSPNATLMQYAEDELRRRGALRVLDLGCGAGRNAVPLARLGADVLGIDLSWPMLGAARDRAREQPLTTRCQLVLAPMDALPVADCGIDLLIAHGVWNLAHSADEFRRALREGARVTKPGGALFVFTFSRNTFGPDATPVAEPFVFDEFSGEPNCFLTEKQLLDELAQAGFVPDAKLPLREHNQVRPGALRAASGPPAIYEGGFRRVPDRDV